MELTLSLAQIDIQTGKPDENLDNVTHWIREASAVGSDLILLPELWSTGYDLQNWKRHASILGEGIFTQLSQLARQHHIWIGGSNLEARQGAAYNTFTLFNPAGELMACYRKIHLFRLMDEDRWLAAGNQPVLIELPWGRTGLAICYDLRFPEIFRSYAVKGASLVLICAEWPAPRISHWQTLLRARAIENQVFVAAVNRVGQTENDQFGGHSAVVGPWGEETAVSSDQETLLVTEIDLAEVEKVRERIPVMKDRRPDIYGDPGDVSRDG